MGRHQKWHLRDFSVGQTRASMPAIMDVALLGSRMSGKKARAPECHHVVKKPVRRGRVA